MLRNSNYSLFNKFSRRDALRAFFFIPLGAFAALNLAACESLSLYDEKGLHSPGLGALAAGKTRVYGAAVQDWQLRDAGFTKALRREVNMLVPEGELKWDVVRPSQDVFDFTRYRRIADFAEANGMAVRGAPLVWHVANPKWLEPALTNKKISEKILRTHITRMITETSPLIQNWDVVNEALDVYSSRTDGLRQTLWLKAIGPEYVPLSFHYAHEANSSLTLTYNDFGFEEGGPKGHLKRRALLNLLDHCIKEGVPIHALGIQSHLQAGLPLGGDDFLSFLKEVRARGLQIYVTELDVDLRKLSGRMDEKITAAQNYVRVYLDMLQQSGSVDMLLTWGLSDRYSWLHKYSPDLAGALPLDRNYDRAALWETLKSGWLQA